MFPIINIIIKKFKKSKNLKGSTSDDNFVTPYVRFFEY